MKPDLDRLDVEFALQAAPNVRVTSEGFVVGNGPPERTLPGVVLDWTQVRKYFRDQKLVCWSSDAVRGVGGKRCETCSDRSRCSLRIRIALERAAGPEPAASGLTASERLLTLEFSYTSCRNFLSYARRIRDTDGDLSRVPTRMSVVPRGHWGEVKFEVDADLFHAVDPQPQRDTAPGA